MKPIHKSVLFPLVIAASSILSIAQSPATPAKSVSITKEAPAKPVKDAAPLSEVETLKLELANTKAQLLQAQTSILQMQQQQLQAEAATALKGINDARPGYSFNPGTGHFDPTPPAPKK